MALTESKAGDFGAHPTDFSLKCTDEGFLSLKDVMGKRGILVAFICNHCPYVLAKIERLTDAIHQLEEMGIGSVAIMPNDTDRYPDDSFHNMIRFKSDHGLSCPYVIDESQEVARAYGAVCTPDFFLYMNTNKGEKANLVYRGRLDSGGSHNNPDDIPELMNAAREFLASGSVMQKQYPSVGCSIKWRE